MGDFFESRPLIYLITEGAATTDNFAEKKPQILKLIERAVRQKISLIQIREKKLSARQVFELTRQAARLTRHTATKLLVNNRADIALAAGADGVHLTSRSIPTRLIRSNFPRGFVIGVSAHSLDIVRMARTAGADFATFGPVFATPSKARYGQPQGLERLREVCLELETFPVIALGGINKSNFQSALDNGAGGFAAIRFLNEELGRDVYCPLLADLCSLKNT